MQFLMQILGRAAPTAYPFLLPPHERAIELPARRPQNLDNAPFNIASARGLRRADRTLEPGDDGAYRVVLGIARPIRAHRVNLIVDERQLPDHRRSQHERIEIR